ncbi:MAG: TldD/PmbA family protein [Candidatus Poseidoniaceae archaeon]|jgi:PmbA protein|nr:TldD/PmbA family protein [Candidatus Poseidoniaceae archaeon]
MTMIPDDAVERLLDSAQKIGNSCETLGIEQWEVFATQGYGHSLDFEAGKISMASGGGDGGFGLRVVEEGRYGYAHLVDPSGADRAVHEAISIARKSPAISGFELPANQETSKVGGMLDKQILNLGPEDLLEQGDIVLEKVVELDKRAIAVGGGIGIGASAGAIVTSSGIEDGGIQTSHGIGIHVSIDEDDELTSSYEGDSSRKLIKDITKSVEKAVHWSQVTRNKIPGGETSDCPVLLTSDAFSPLFSMVAPPALSGERMARNESFWSGKMGEIVIADHLSLKNDGRMEGGSSSGSRDGEGIPTQTRNLVENGRLLGENWSTRDAAKMVAEGRVDKAKSTGSASRSGHTSPPICGCSDLSLLSRNNQHSRDRLIEEMNDGYIIHSVMGAHTANPTSGDFSVTTSTILRVESGELVGALSQAGFSGNMAKALAGRVVLGNTISKKGSYTSGTMHVPDVLMFDELRVNPA